MLENGKWVYALPIPSYRGLCSATGSSYFAEEQERALNSQRRVTFDLLEDDLHENLASPKTPIEDPALKSPTIRSTLSSIFKKKRSAAVSDPALPATEVAPSQAPDVKIGEFGMNPSVTQDLESKSILGFKKKKKVLAPIIITPYQGWVFLLGAIRGEDTM